MSFVNLPPEVLGDITWLLKCPHIFKLWLIGDKMLCQKLQSGRAVQKLCHTQKKGKPVPTLANYPLMNHLTHIEIKIGLFVLPFKIDEDLIISLPRTLEFLSLELSNDHFAVQGALKRVPDLFPRLKTLELLGNSIVGDEIFCASELTLPQSLTNFKSFCLVDHCEQLTFPPHIHELHIHVRRGDHLTDAPITLERLEIHFRQLPTFCPLLPSSLTWLVMPCANDDVDPWEFSLLPPSLTHLAVDELHEAQILSLPLSIRSLEGTSDYELNDDEVKALSRLVNLTQLQSLAPYDLSFGLAIHLPRQLRSISSIVPHDDVCNLPSSLTELNISYDTELESEKTKKMQDWYFPSLTRLETDHCDAQLLSMLPATLTELSVDYGEDSFDMAELLPISLKSFRWGIYGRELATIKSQNCLASLPKTITRLCGFHCPGKKPNPSTFLNLDAEAVFALPPSLIELQLGPISIPNLKWLCELPQMLTNLNIGIQTEIITDFETDFYWPPSLVQIELQLHFALPNGFTSLLRSIPRGVKRCYLTSFADYDSGLKNEDLGDFLAGRLIKHLILPKSKFIDELCLPMVPRSLQQLQFERYGSSPVWWLR